MHNRGKRLCRLPDFAFGKCEREAVPAHEQLIGFIERQRAAVGLEHQVIANVRPIIQPHGVILHADMGAVAVDGDRRNRVGQLIDQQLAPAKRGDQRIIGHMQQRERENYAALPVPYP